MTHGPRPPLALALPAIAGALLMLAQPARAQQEAPKAESMERAQKAADAVFHWIKLNGDKGANRQQPAPAPAPAPAPKKPAPVAAAPRPAPAPAPSAAPAAAPTATAATAAPPAVAAAAQPAPTPEPEPERTPVLLASTEPTPAPAAPMAAAAQAAEPPPKPAAQEEPDEPLKLLFKVDPSLPRQMQQTSFRNGFAQVQFTVAPDGSVQQVSVIKATHARLGTAAVDAVRQWRFAPIRKAREAAVEVAFNNDSE